MPLEVVSRIALSISSVTDFVRFCSCTKTLRTLYLNVSFRRNWFAIWMKNYPPECDSEERKVLAEIAKEKCVPFAAANWIRLKLPTSELHDYMRRWAINCLGARKMPILPSDAKIRDAFVVHFWIRALPMFLWNQLSVVDMVDSNESPAAIPLIHGINDGTADVKRLAGPDFSSILKFVFEFCDSDSSSLNEDGGIDPWHGNQDTIIKTTKILPEGLFEATRYSWISDLRSDWVKQFSKTAFGGVVQEWEKLINNSPNSDVLKFNYVEFRSLQLALIQKLVTWSEMMDEDSDNDSIIESLNQIIRYIE
ncbi:hypothetical protein HK096_009798 [Nowakowskiella sp. JEL0078]|nr:hypothetical protein HK096_009798 [Nowakowskiella sp. JEL0078]